MLEKRQGVNWPFFFWQPVSLILRRKASKVTGKMSERNFLEHKMEKTMEIAWALITRNSHLQ